MTAIWVAVLVPAATTITTRNGARNSSAATAAPRPASRAGSSDSDCPAPNVCTATSAASRAIGTNSAKRRTRGLSSTPRGTINPVS